MADPKQREGRGRPKKLRQREVNGCNNSSFLFHLILYYSNSISFYSIPIQTCTDSFFDFFLFFSSHSVFGLLYYANFSIGLNNGLS